MSGSSNVAIIAIADPFPLLDGFFIRSDFQFLQVRSFFRTYAAQIYWVKLKLTNLFFNYPLMTERISNCWRHFYQIYHQRKECSILFHRVYFCSFFTLLPMSAL